MVVYVNVRSFLLGVFGVVTCGDIMGEVYLDAAVLSGNDMALRAPCEEYAFRAAD